MLAKVVCVLFLLCACTSARNVGIWHGKKAEPGQFPSTVSLNFNYDGLIMHWCGGSIIDKQFIVTAAHCLELDLDYWAVVGSLNPLEGGTSYNISAKFIHENYTGGLIDGFPPYNDIGLIKIDGEIFFSDTAQTIEIGEAEADNTCDFAGWGSTEEIESPTDLMYTNLATLNDEDCASLAEGGLFNYTAEPYQICAVGQNGSSPCFKDSGGPLICDFKLVGVVSYSIGDCGEKYPHVFTRPAYYVDWMRNIIKNNS